jgi:hypothetical protein
MVKGFNLNFESNKNKGNSENNLNLKSKSEYDETESIKNKKDALPFKLISNLKLKSFIKILETNFLQRKTVKKMKKLM